MSPVSFSQRLRLTFLALCTGFVLLGSALAILAYRPFLRIDEGVDALALSRARSAAADRCANERFTSNALLLGGADLSERLTRQLQIERAACNRGLSEYAAAIASWHAAPYASRASMQSGVWDAASRLESSREAVDACMRLGTRRLDVDCMSRAGQGLADGLAQFERVGEDVDRVLRQADPVLSSRLLEVRILDEYLSLAGNFISDVLPWMAAEREPDAATLRRVEVRWVRLAELDHLLSARRGELEAPPSAGNVSTVRGDPMEASFALIRATHERLTSGRRDAVSPLQRSQQLAQALQRVRHARETVLRSLESGIDLHREMARWRAGGIGLLLVVVLGGELWVWRCLRRQVFEPLTQMNTALLALDYPHIDRGAVPNGDALSSALSRLQQCMQEREHADGERDALRQRLDEALDLDPSSGLLNAGALDRIGEDFSRPFGARERRATLILFESDRYGEIRDRYGRAGADALVRQLAAIARALVRADEALASLGADTFAILMIGHRRGEARQLTNELKRQVEERGITLPNGERLDVELRFGIAEGSRGVVGWRDLFSRADGALNVRRLRRPDAGDGEAGTSA